MAIGAWRVSSLAFVAIFFAGFGEGLVAAPVKHPPKKAAPVDPNAATFEAAKAAVAYTLRDPDSARFRDLHMVRVTVEEGWKVCGQVNGHNGYGAYAGFSDFAYLPTSGRVIMASEDHRFPDGLRGCQ